nr:hypothetical protein [Bifidobacterium dentium]
MAVPFECELVQWLSSQPELAEVPVSTDVPANRPSKFISIERTGGERTKILDRPELAIQCWAQSSVEAAELADMLVDVVLPRVYELADLGAFSVNSIYNYPLDETQPRHQITADAVVHTAVRRSK